MNVCAVLSFGYKIRPRTFGCIAMSSGVLFMLRSRFGVQVVLSRFSVRLLYFVQAKTLGIDICISLLHSCLCV